MAEDLPRLKPGEDDADGPRASTTPASLRRPAATERAIAAFAQALTASGFWFTRAANNLAIVEGRE